MMSGASDYIRANQNQVDTGTNEVAAVTPKKLLNNFIFNTSSNGRIKLPSWLGGFTVQWFYFVAPATSNNYYLYPYSFDNTVFGVFVHMRTDSGQSYALGSSAEELGRTKIFNSNGQIKSGFALACGR